jgi:hypothetical protein
MHFTVFNINMTEEGTITNPIIIDSDDNDIISITFSDSELEENVGVWKNRMLHGRTKRIL